MRIKLITVLGLTWLASSALMPIAIAQTAGVAVVVNEKNPITQLRSSELRQIFAGEKRSWAGGIPIKIFVRAPGANERVALLRLMGMTEDEYRKYWASQVFRGEAQTEPIALFSNGMQREALLAYPGAVALVNAQDVRPPMKVVKVDGRIPGETGYPLN
jgi:ABC-type phosphate transport system substrate-binding protein